MLEAVNFREIFESRTGDAMKQKPTLTPRQQLEAARVRDPDEGYVSAAFMATQARKVGRAAMPPAEPNDLDAGEGARRKMPMRYD